MSIKQLAYILFVAISVVFILTVGKNLLIPLVFALLLWFVVKQIRFFIDRVEFIRKWIPIWVKYLFSLSLIIIAIHFVISIVISNISLLLVSYQKYADNIEVLIHRINDTFHINLMEYIEVYFEDFDFGSILLSVFNYSTDFVAKATLVFLYALFIFLEEPAFKKKLLMILPDKEQFESTYSFLQKVEFSVSKYLGLKTLISLITAILTYFVLLVFDVDFPVFWAFLTFVLNFIPNIGSIVATMLPVFFSLLQFGSFMPGILVLVLVGAIQFLIGNILDPKIMGNSVNLSPFIIILSLSFWGAIWGITGMLMSVPITSVIVIILSKMPDTKKFAIMLSGDGEV